MDVDDNSTEETSDGLVHIWQGFQDVSPRPVPALQGVSVLKVAIGGRHSAFLTQHHLVLTSGDNQYGQLGVGCSGGLYETPTLVEALQDVMIVDVACGSRHTAVVTSQGDVYCWGDSSAGQCGTGKTQAYSSPQLVQICDPPKRNSCSHVESETDSIVTVERIACGDCHTVAVSDIGELWTWGSGLALGLNRQENALSPERVQYLEGRRVLSAACGAHHTLALVQKLGKSTLDRRSSSLEAGRRSKSRSRSPIINNVQLHKNRPSTCVKCQEEIYTYTETSDACIISDKHTCPLGLEVNGGKGQMLLTEGKMLGNGDVEVGGKSGQNKQVNGDKLGSSSSSETSSVKTSPGHSSLESIQEESAANSRQAKLKGQPKADHISDSDPINLALPNHSSHENEDKEGCDSSPAHGSGNRSKSVSPVPPLSIPPEISSLEVNKAEDQINSQGEENDIILESRSEPSTKESLNCVSTGELLQNGAMCTSDVYTQEKRTEGNVSLQDVSVQQTDLPDSKLEETREHHSGSVSSIGTLQKSRSSFLNESEAKSFLEKTLAGEDDFEASSRTKMDDDQPSSPFVKHMENILQYVPSSPAQVQEYVTTLTKNVVSNIKTSIDKFAFVSAQTNVELDTLSKSSSQDSLANVGRDSPITRRKFETRLGHVRDAEEVMFTSCQPLYTCNTMPRSTSMGGINRASHNSERKGSLPIAALSLAKKTSFLSSQTEVVLDTEVWSWGEGRKGQLGLGDMLDRPSPCCIKFLSDKRVVKLAAGAFHSLALTADSTVYTNGINNYGQLGHTDDSGCASPHKIRTLSGTPIWDIAAGEFHSVVIADGTGFCPDIYYTGKHPSDDSQAGFTSQLTRIGALRKVGWIRQLAGGGQMCVSLSDRNVTGHIATVHEFAATERAFLQQLLQVNSTLLLPFLSTDVFKAVETTIYGTVIKLLMDAFQHVNDVVATNALELTHVLQRTLDMDSLHLFTKSQECVATFQNYSKCFGDALALGAFDFVVKTASAFFEKNKEKLSDMLEPGRVDKSNIAISFRRLLQIPLLRLKDYSKLINKLALKYPPYTGEHHHMASSAQSWDTLKIDASREHKQAENTKKFWEICPSKFAEALRIPGRRLICESKGNPISLPSSGRFSMHWLILFNDVFVHGQYSMHQTFPLSTIWVEAVPDSETLKNGIILTMPEEVLTLTSPGPSEKAEWLWAINQAIDKMLTDQKNLVRPVVPGGRLTPPLARQATHVFYKNPMMKDAKYVGMWLSGKMHGHGELHWADGRKYIGKFKQGQQCGHGVFTQMKEGREEVYDGHWKEGKLNGLGTVKYANGDVYEGYFKDGKKHGHGVLRQGRFTSGSSLGTIYVGEWSNDKKSGYGVLDDVSKGQKYMGMWQEDCRHGIGIIVTLDGMYFEGNFTQNKMTGLGLLMTDDNSSYEGEFSGGPNLYGKGTLTLPNGDYIEGHFNGSFTEGIKVSGTFFKATEPVTERKGFTHALGLVPKMFGELSVPANRKWNDIFQHCQSLLGCHGNKMVDTAKAWEAVAVIVSAGKKSLKEEGKKASTPMGCLDELEKIPPYTHGHLYYEDYIQVKAYLTKAFDTAFHPVGKLMEGLVDVYRATYVGVGAHPRLLYHAVNEVKSYVSRVYSLVQLLFPALPTQEGPVQIFTRKGEALLQQGQDEGDEPSDVVTPGELLHPLLLPRLYPPLFTLYALYNEREDERYWKRVLMWNKQPDMALMAYLGMDQMFWLLDESMFTDTRMRLSSVRDQCYREAVETLQHISTAFSPAEKLQLIQKTFDEINKAVQAAVGSGHLWCMDDLFPVFLYVVVRARIRHLGAEIHLVDDLMESHLQHGELGIMFTTLKACYFQIQNEKMQ